MNCIINVLKANTQWVEIECVFYVLGTKSRREKPDVGGKGEESLCNCCWGGRGIPGPVFPSATLREKWGFPEILAEIWRGKKKRRGKRNLRQTHPNSLRI